MLVIRVECNLENLQKSLKRTSSQICIFTKNLVYIPDEIMT